MSITFKTALATALLAALGCAAQAAPAATASISVPAPQVQFGPTGVSDGTHGELLAGPAYGNLSKGPHGTFVRMPAGFVSHTHIHTGAYWAVVIAGVAVNGKPNTTDVLLPVGSYWYQKGGEPHVTQCVSTSECLFFISQDGAFDYVVDKAMH